MQAQELARLEGAARVAYERQLQEQLDSPERLRAVYGDRFADADYRQQAEQLCQVAARTFNVPICLITVLDDTTQHVTVGFGLDDASDTPVQESYCQHVVGTQGPVAINQATEHNLVCATPAALHKNLHAYLGVPLVWDGQVVGSFCIVDTAPRRWTPADVLMLAELGAVLTRFRGSGDPDR